MPILLPPNFALYDQVRQIETLFTEQVFEGSATVPDRSRHRHQKRISGSQVLSGLPGIPARAEHESLPPPP